MITIYWSWVLVGFIVGLALGVAISFFVTWLVEKQMAIESGNDFARGFDRGWDCGKEHQQLMDNSDNVSTNMISDETREQLLNWLHGEDTEC